MHSLEPMRKPTETKAIAWLLTVTWKPLCYHQHYLPNIIHAIIAVKIGAEDLIVSEKETATYFKVMREHTIVANLKKENGIVS